MIVATLIKTKSIKSLLFFRGEGGGGGGGVSGVYYIEILGNNSTTTTKSMLGSLLPSVMLLYPERLATFEKSRNEDKKIQYNIEN